MRRRKEKLYSDFNLSQLNKERRAEVLRHIDYLTDRLALKLDADGQRLLKELIFYLRLL